MNINSHASMKKGGEEMPKDKKKDKGKGKKK